MDGNCSLYPALPIGNLGASPIQCGNELVGGTAVCRGIGDCSNNPNDILTKYYDE